MTTTFEGKWGFYPCEWATYRKLKQLNMALTRARRLAANWNRWDRKLSHNRVMRKKIRNEAGQVVGFEAPVPMPEPPLCPVFGLSRREDIEADYRKARYPVGKEDVKPLALSLAEIDRLLGLLG